LLVKETLDVLGLASFPKTSGTAEGFHVLVPIERRATYDDTRRFSEIVAGALARSHRGLVTTEWSKAKRRGVLIDANQNGGGKRSATVQSATTRSFRERSGSWCRWYGRVTNQPGKPRRRRPSTSAMPL